MKYYATNNFYKWYKNEYYEENINSFKIGQQQQQKKILNWSAFESQILFLYMHCILFINQEEKYWNCNYYLHYDNDNNNK